MRWLPLLLLGLLAVTGPVRAREAAPCTAAAVCGESLALSTGGSLRYFRSRPLTPSQAVTRALIVVHGNGRNAEDYFDHAVAAAKLERRLDDVLLLAPNFRTRADAPAPGEHYWSSRGWKRGNRSRDRLRVSSFAVMDELLARVCAGQPSLFPNLRVVVIAGHSAGGQFVNRYAGGGAGCPNRTVQVRYLVMNPSSYLYVDGRRRITNGGAFEIPRTSCRGYDDYKYGLRDLNAYMRRVGAAEIRRRLFTRSTWYLAGEADRHADRNLEQNCEAQLQGPHRLARYANYREYAGLFGDWTGSVFATVPGIGHSGSRMLASEAARSVIFH
jgi:hypothetical protein